MTDDEREARIDNIGDNLLGLVEDLIAGRRRVVVKHSHRPGRQEVYSLEIEDVEAPAEIVEVGPASPRIGSPSPCDVCGKAGKWMVVEVEDPALSNRDIPQGVDLALCEDHAAERTVFDDGSPL